MSSNLVRIREKFSKGELVLGVCVSLSDPVISEIFCKCGFDFIWIDYEHGALDRKLIDMHIMAACGAGAAPFVRLPNNDPALAKPILDMGPAAIIFPFIKTVEDAKLAVSSCKYPPEGIRGFGPRRANDYYTINTTEYLKTSQSEPWVILQIEHKEAVANMERIVQVEGVDSIVVGPCDLSGSLGRLGETDHPENITLIDKICTVCNDANMPLGASIGIADQDVYKTWIDRGICWIDCGNDISYLVRGGKKTIQDVNSMYKECHGT